LVKCIITQGLGKAGAQGFPGPQIIAESKIAPDDVFEEPNCLSCNKLLDHVAQYGSNGEEALVSMANVGETGLVEENLLNDEDGNGLGKFRASFHDAKAEGYDLRGQQEMDYGVVVILLWGAYEWDRGVVTRVGTKCVHTLTRAPMTPKDVRRRYSNGRVLDVVFKNGYKNSGIWAVDHLVSIFKSFFSIGKEGIHTTQKELASFGVRSDALQQCKRVTHTIRDMCGEVRRGK
jgi:hypothetical protein